MLLKKPTPWRSEKYRRFVASFPCCVPGCGRVDVQCHHEQREGEGGMATKVGDERGVPLCCGHHDERTTGNRAVWEAWGVDSKEVIAWVQRQWVRRGNARDWEKVETKPRRKRTAGCRVPQKCRLLISRV